MSWNNTAWALLQHIEFTIEEKEIVTGRSVVFERLKPSIYEHKKQTSLEKHEFFYE